MSFMQGLLANVENKFYFGIGGLGDFFFTDGNILR